MTTVGAVIVRLLAGRATMRGEGSTLASVIICRNRMMAVQSASPDAASRS